MAKSDLPATTKLVLHTVGLHMNGDGESCFPSLAMIALESSLSRRSAIRHVNAAVDGGWLSIERRQSGSGDPDSNVYRPAFPDAEGSDRGSLPSERQSPGDDRDSPQVVTEGHQGSDTESLGVVTEMHPNSPRELSKEKTIGRNASDDAFERWFAEFWKLYPRKVAKPRALKAFKAALKVASHDEIIAGLKRYIKAREGRDKTFTAYPASWLNDQRWNDPETELGGTAEQTADQWFETLKAI